MRPTIALMVVSLFFLPLQGCTVRSAPSAVTRQSQPQVQTQAARKQASDSERQAYAEREHQAGKLEKFKGGSHGIVTLILVVVIVIVILYLLKVI
jgi:hypothetical protein